MRWKTEGIGVNAYTHWDAIPLARRNVTRNKRLVVICETEFFVVVFHAFNYQLNFRIYGSASVDGVMTKAFVRLR